jgi:hypothetical protein
MMMIVEEIVLLTNDPALLATSRSVFDSSRAGNQYG